MIDIISAVTAIGGSGFIIVGRDIWLARNSVKNSKAAEKRNQAREPLIVENILLGNTTKVTEIFQAGIAELEDAKKRAVEELRDTRTRLESKVSGLSQELDRQRKENERKESKIQELYKKLGELHDKLDKIQKQKE